MDLDTLFDAAMAGDAHAIAQLEMEADTLSDHEETILHLQSLKGNIERVRFILREFPHKNLLAKLTAFKQSALHLAIFRGRTEVVKVLIDAARHMPPPSDDDEYPITSFQAFLRQANGYMETALHAAVREGHLAIVKLLVEADPTDTHIQNDTDETPMYIAVKTGLHHIAEIISTTCIAPSLLGPHWSAVGRIKNQDGAESPGGHTALSLLGPQYSAVGRIKNRDRGKSPGGSPYKIMDKDALYAAAIAKDADAIAALEMHAGKRNKYEETILHTESQNGNREHVRFILRKFADKNLLLKLNKDKRTALHLAVSNGHTEVAEILIDKARHLPTPSSTNEITDDDNSVTSFHAFLRQADNRMDTALHEAVKKRNVDLVKLLVEADPSDKHIQNEGGRTPMYIAVEEEFNDIAEIISTTCTAPSLLGPDCSVVVRNKNFEQAKSPCGSLYKIMHKDALYAAAIAGDADATTAFGMHARKLDENCSTILHIESWNGNTEHVRFILREFAPKYLTVAKDPPDAVTSLQAFLRLINIYMETALHLAVRNNEEEIVKLLVEADPSDTHTQTIDGKAPMYIAVEKGYNDIADIIYKTCTAPSLDGPNGSTVVRIRSLEQGKSPGGTLFKIMDRYAFFVAAIAGDADAIAKLETEADILNEGEETIVDVESQNGYTERVQFILKEFAKKYLLSTLDYDAHTALHLAANYGHTEGAEIIIEVARHLYPSSDNDNTRENPSTSFRAFLRQSDDNKDSALHVAVKKGHAPMVKLLVEADPSDTHIQNKGGKTPMYIAVEQGYNDIVEIISTTCTAPSLSGPDGSAVVRIENLDQAKSPGGSHYKIVDNDALYAAAIARNADAIAALEMQTHKLNEYKESILHTESKKGKTEHVRFILGEFPEKNLLVKLDNSNQTALHLASYEGHTEVAEILINAARHLLPSSPHDDNTDGDNPVISFQAFLRQAEAFLETALHRDDDDNPVISFQAFLRQADACLKTALHRAVEKGHAPIVKLLVEADPGDKHIQNERGRTPMYIAVERGYSDIVEIISTTCTAPSLNGPDGSAVVRIKNLDQAKSPGGSLYKIVDNDALYAAAIARNADAIAALEMQADKLNKHEESILHTESEKGKTEHVQFIIREFPDKNLLVKLNNFKRTALHLASSKGHTEVAEILINAARHLLPTTFHAFLRQADDEMDTALHYAVKNGDVALVELLLEVDPSDSYTQNSQGETPLYIAVDSGYYDIAKMICTTCTAASNLDAPGGSTTLLHILIKNTAQEQDMDAIAEITQTVIKKYMHEPAEMIMLLDRTDEERCTILQLAVERNHLDTVNLILQAVESIVWNSTIYMDLTPLIHTFMSIKSLSYKAMDEEYIDMFNSLSTIYQKCEKWVKKIASNVDIAKMQLISAICRRQEESVISMLKERYAEHLVTFADSVGWTALHYAAYHEFDIMIPSILKAQKKFRHPFVYQDMLSTPFHVAAAKGHTSTVICLMQSWPSSPSAYTLVDKNEQNILHLAALRSKKEMILGILQHCSQELKEEFVNKQDNNGDTPLHILIRRGCFIPELLKYQGLHLRVENKRRWTAADMLYFDREVIENQVQIKLVIDGLHPSKDIFSNSVLPSIRMRKDKILHEQEKLKVQGKYAAMKEDTDAIATCFADAIAGDAISVAALKMKADKPNELEETILHVESKKGNIENVRFIVSEFANKSLLGELDRSKQTALHLAAQHGHVQVVKALIDAARLWPSSSANEDAHNPVSSFRDFIRQANVPNLNTALHLAVLDGNVAIVKLLVEADPNDSHVQNNEGKTPIYIAAENGYKDIIKEICTACTTLSLDGPGGRTTALHALIQNMDRGGEIDVVGMMVNTAKCWSTAQNASDADFKALFNRKDKSERTVLQLAVERNDVNAVTLILQEDPAYQLGGEMKRNNLMRLICKAIDNEYSADIIKSLSETYKAGIMDHDPNDVLDLILAIHKLDKDSVLNLLGKAKNLVTFTEDNGWTPLHYAVYYEFDWILDAIIKAQKDVEHPFVLQKMETTPFYVAVKHGYTSTLVRLMELWPASSFTEGSPYTIVTQEHQNILHLAAGADPVENRKVVADSADKRKAVADNRKEMVKSILKHCPKKYKDDMLKQPDNNGDTPLHLLISQGCFIPQLVKHKGLDTEKRNNQDYTPMDMLYVEDAVVEDQVHIKIAIDEVQNDQSVRKLWGKKAEKEADIWKCNKTTPSNRKNKDVKFEVEKKDLEQKMHKQRREDLERYKTRTNTQILVTALITTVTFTVGFTMPGGLHQSGEVGEGLVVLSKRRAFNIFMMSDALALLMSTSSLFLYFLESMNDDPHQVSLLNASSTVLNILSIMGMMLTFISGTYVVLSDSPVLAIAVCITGSLFFFLILFLWIIKIAYARHLKKNKD